MPAIRSEALLLRSVDFGESDRIVHFLTRDQGRLTAIAKGARLGPLMAELLGKATGVCGGMGGSMHLADFSVGSLGETGIVGAGIPIAVGAGLSARVRGTDQVCVAFFGDGASNHGTFHESLNLAAIWKLPVVFFCENNAYAATTPLARATSVDDIADRAAGYAWRLEEA